MIGNVKGKATEAAAFRGRVEPGCSERQQELRPQLLVFDDEFFSKGQHKVTRHPCARSGAVDLNGA